MWFTCNPAAQNCANSRRFRPLVGEQSGKRSDEFPVGIEPQHFEARHPALTETFAVGIQSSLLWGIRHIQ